MKSTPADTSERYRPPAITGHEIVRIRLLDRLTSVGAASAGARVTLVRSPAGFGKTTLLAQAYRQVVARSGAAVWLGCGSIDAASRHFLESLYLAATLIGIEPDDFEFTATDLARRLAQVDPSVFIFLDEYERLAGSPAEDVMEHLASALPPQAHIVVGSRQSPRSWFLQRELRGDAGTIDALELRLTGDELRSVLQERFNTAEIAQLEALTEGWPMAVQLARLRCRDAQSLTDLLAVIERGGSGLFEYLTERVV
jgi:ATP/maltotriose-dependent transcriptional regulator MalT